MSMQDEFGVTSSASSDEQSFPCSASQEPFWFMDEMNPGDPALNVALRWELEGRFSPATVEQAFQAVIARHEILRTRFIERDGEPAQIVAPHVPFKLSVVDLTMIPEESRLADAVALGQREARRPFDLARAPLIRATLLRLAPDRAFVLVTAHHIVFDAWSITIIARDFGAFAEAIDAGTAPALPELPLQYGDYCLWQQAYFASVGFAESLDYWRRQLAGAPYFTLPPDHERRKGGARGGEILIRQLPPGLSGAIENIGRSQNVTLFVFGSAVLAALLARLSGKTDILFATQNAGRDDVDLENLIGPFINTLALRFDAADDPAFDAFLVTVNETVQAAMANASAPFHKLVEILNPARDLDRPSLVAINFTVVFHDVIVKRVRHGGFYLKAHPSTSPGALYDLNVFLSRWPEGWRISLEYDSTLFEAATADRFLGAVAEAFAFAFANPKARLSEFPRPLLKAPQPSPLLPSLALPAPAEAFALPAPAQVGTASSAPTLDARFEAIAAAAGRTRALAEGERALSYAELDQRSNQAARRMIALGVRPGDFVGLLTQRSIEAIVAILATLKAGAAYVPFDPAYPREQLAFMAEDCGLALALAEPASRQHAPEGHFFADLGAFLADAARESDAPLASVNTPESVAYVMYTSGSTGRPKGVVIPHRGVARLVLGQSYADFTSHEVILHAAPLAFDASTFEIWGALLNGGQLAIIREPRPSLDEICEAIQRHGATLAWFTAGLFNLLVDERIEGLRPLKLILTGGEALSPAHVGKALAGLPQTRIVNGYGPTENTTFTCTHEATLDDLGPDGAGAIPIGRPIAGSDVFILGPDLKPVKNGVAGELCCGGPGVALGYLGRPELTDEKFPASPFGPGRIYRSGDMALRRSDGEIMFLGRADRQVKINGKRVELEEIENVLRADARVLDALVERRDDHPARPLVAYLKLAAPARDSAAQGADILAALRVRLPDHMVPSAAVVLAEFPLTPNGKVDRRALPAPDVLAAGDAQTADADWTPMERLAGEIWRDVLKRDDIGLDANFFDLGGHSMMATRIAARASKSLGVKAPVAGLFKAPVLKEYAAFLASLAKTPAGAEAPPAPKPPERPDCVAPAPPLALPAQAPRSPERLIAERPNEEDWRIIAIQPSGDKTAIIALNDPLLYYGVSREIGADRPLIGIAPFDPDRRETLPDRAFEDICADYVALIRKAQPRGPYILAGYCVAGVLAYEAARQLRAQGEEVPLVILADSWAPGYVRSLFWPRRMIAEITFRFYVLRHQLELTSAGHMTFGELLASYRIVRESRILDLAVALRLIKTKPVGRDDGQDQWFLGHLNKARAAYEAQETLGDVVVLQSDIIVTPFTEKGLGWTKLVKGRLSLRRIPGWHGEMFAARGARAIAAALVPLLADADAKAQAGAPERPQPERNE